MEENFAPSIQPPFFSWPSATYSIRMDGWIYKAACDADPAVRERPTDNNGRGFKRHISKSYKNRKEEKLNIFFFGFTPKKKIPLPKNIK
jgi:hypothetical protein